MITKTVTKFLLVILLTLTITVGAGIATNLFAIHLTPSVYACPSTGGGGC